MSHPDPTVTLCGNCGTPLSGAFCQTCGQKAVGPDVSLHDFFHEAVEEFAHVDGKIVQTLRLLLTQSRAPAKVVQERLGHRKIGPTLDTYAHVLPSMQRAALLHRK